MLYAVYHLLNCTIISIVKDREEAEKARDYYNKLFDDIFYVVIPYDKEEGLLHGHI